MDLDATMATMTDEPYVNHVPVMTGGVGSRGCAASTATHFIGKWPQDVEITPVSRTVGDDQVVDELVLSFTHDIEMPQLLPGVAPTGKHVRLAFCVVVGFDGRQGRARAHLLGSGVVPVQVGLLDRAGLPVTGAEQAENVLDPRAHPLNELIRPPRSHGRSITRRCAGISRAAPSPSSSRTSRARRGCCTRSVRTPMRRRSPSTVACCGRRSPRTAASRSTRRATRSSSPSRPPRARCGRASAPARRSRLGRSPFAWACTRARRRVTARGLRRRRRAPRRARRRARARRPDRALARDRGAARRPASSATSGSTG